VAEEKEIRIVLTQEQREVVRRLSGQFVEAIELTPDEPAAGKDVAEDQKQQSGTVKFRWRLSAATGIPRQAWVSEDGEPGPSSR
jgi:hypothetical protein